MNRTVCGWERIANLNSTMVQGESAGGLRQQVRQHVGCQGIDVLEVARGAIEATEALAHAAAVVAQPWRTAREAAVKKTSMNDRRDWPTRVSTSIAAVHVTLVELRATAWKHTVLSLVPALRFIDGGRWVIARGAVPCTPARFRVRSLITAPGIQREDLRREQSGPKNSGACTSPSPMPTVQEESHTHTITAS